MWEILLNYLHNEEEKLNHSGFRRGSDINQNSIWYYIDRHSDLSNAFFSTIVGEMIILNNNLYVQSLGVLNDAELAEEISKSFNDDLVKKLFWNESMTRLLNKFAMIYNMEEMNSYENYGELVETDNDKIDSTYLRGIIQVKDGYSFRVKDVKRADAGANFIREKEIYENGIQKVVYNFQEVRSNIRIIQKVKNEYTPLVLEGDSESILNKKQEIEEAISGLDFTFNDLLNGKVPNYSGVIYGHYYLNSGNINKMFEFTIPVENISVNKYNTSNNYKVIMNNNNQKVKDFLENEEYYNERGFRINKYYNLKLEKEIKLIVKPWVIPWYNINGHSYKYVRGVDRINGVLANKDRLNFTVDQNGNDLELKTDHQWIRLLMPQNKRRVEAEDLNRNFWVIGQVISAIEAYLFDENSPFAAIFKGLLNEVMQLWENVLYLWAAIAAVSCIKYTKVHKEVIYIPNDKMQQYLKYDNFEQELSNDVSEIIEPYLNKYKDSNLCLIIAQREDNYEHNYFATERYIGAYLLDRNKQRDGKSGVTWIAFGSEAFVSFNKNKDNSDHCLTKISNSLKETNSKYYTIGAFEDVSGQITDVHSQLYYGIIRPIYTINCNINSNNELEFNNFKIDYFDVARLIFGASSNKALTLTVNSSGQSSFDSGTFVSLPNSSIEIEEGFYQGEVLSYYNLTAPLNLTVHSKRIEAFPRNFQPPNIILNSSKTELELLRDFGEEDEQILDKIVEQGSDNTLYLYTIAHHSIIAGNYDKGEVNYWSINNGNLEKVTLSSKDDSPYKQTFYNEDNQEIILRSFGSSSYIATKAKLYLNINGEKIINQSYPDYPYHLDHDGLKWMKDGSLYTVWTHNYWSGTNVLIAVTTSTVYKVYVKKGESLRKNNWIIEEIVMTGESIIEKFNDNDITKNRPSTVITNLDNNEYSNFVISSADSAMYFISRDQPGETSHTKQYTDNPNSIPCVYNYMSLKIQSTLFYPDGRMERARKQREKSENYHIVNTTIFTPVSDDETTSNWVDMREKEDEYTLLSDPSLIDYWKYPVNGVTK